MQHVCDWQVATVYAIIKHAPVWMHLHREKAVFGRKLHNSLQARISRLKAYAAYEHQKRIGHRSS